MKCANPLYRSQMCLFIFFATTTTLLSYTHPWTATFFDVFRLICISWIWIKQSLWGFHRKKGLIPDLKYLALIMEKYITFIVDILFPEGPVLFDSPRINVLLSFMYPRHTKGEGRIPSLYSGFFPVAPKPKWKWPKPSRKSILHPLKMVRAKITENRCGNRDVMDLDQVPLMWRDKPVEYECTVAANHVSWPISILLRGIHPPIENTNKTWLCPLQGHELS